MILFTKVLRYSCNIFIRRHTSSLPNYGFKLIAEDYGDPVKVVKMIETDQNGCLLDEVEVKVLAAPINPADINTIQGVYAIKPSLPMLLGNEGVAEVIQVGKDCEDLKVGDWVIPRINAMGTWRTHIVAKTKDFIKIPSKLPLSTAATLSVNPCTAYRMLKDFVNLSPGDTVIQNGANSAVGQAVIMLCCAWGINTINVVRDRPDIDQLKKELTQIGATLVLTEKELRKSSAVKEFPQARLALNCTSGTMGTEVLRRLSQGGTMVTYGGMSREPVKIPVSSLIFNDINLRGFWMTRWNKNHHNDNERENMFEELFTLINGGSLRAPTHSLVPVAKYREALEKAMPRNGMVGCKQILVF